MVMRDNTIVLLMLIYHGCADSLSVQSLFWNSTHKRCRDVKTLVSKSKPESSRRKWFGTKLLSFHPEFMSRSNASFTVTDVGCQAECRQKLRRAAGPDGLRMEVFMVNEFVCIHASYFTRLFHAVMCLESFIERFLLLLFGVQQRLEWRK